MELPNVGHRSRSLILIKTVNNRIQKECAQNNSPLQKAIKIYSVLVTLSISSLRNLDIEANKFYDRAHRLYNAAILTWCYTQHALQPYIDSEINHIRHLIKIQFVNKGIEFFNLPSIFKDKSVISSIPTYFENKESPIICYKYNKPIRSTVFNYNKLVTELDIENSIPDS